MRRLAAFAVVLLASTGFAAAAPLPPEDAVAYLLAGVLVGGTSEVGGATFQWEEGAPGAFSGHGTGDGGTLDLLLTITRVSDCEYDAATHVNVNGKDAYDATAHYDFSKITNIALLGASDAQITGSDFCTSEASGVCDAHIAMASPTDQATFSGIYQDFRNGTCH